MEKTIEATYEDGVFKPKTPVELEDHANVCLTIESKPKIYDDDEDPSGYKKEEEKAAFDHLTKHSDKDYSMVDCLSFVVMERKGIREALSVDSDFTHRPTFVRATTCGRAAPIRPWPARTSWRLPLEMNLRIYSEPECHRVRTPVNVTNVISGVLPGSFLPGGLRVAIIR